MIIRLASASDRDGIWAIFHAVVARGDTYTFDPKISREEAMNYWFGPATHTYVAENNELIVGTYILRRNQPGAGSHIANAAYMVAPTAQGQGVGRKMAEHSLGIARQLGFRAMQFNFVVSTNQPALHLWQELGFEIIGVIPGAFLHPDKGYVDAFIMFRSLLD